MSILEQYILDELERYKKQVIDFQDLLDGMTIRNRELTDILNFIKQNMEHEYYQPCDTNIIKMNVWEKHDPDIYNRLVRSLDLSEPPKNT